MTLREKIQSLITAANNKTGESDTTLTDAVQTLVDGYGQGGGGGTGTLLADYTAAEDVSAIEFSNIFSDYYIYVFELTGTMNAVDWIYPTVNNATSLGWYGVSSSVGMQTWNLRIFLIRTPNDAGYNPSPSKCYITSGNRGFLNVSDADSGINYVKFKPYYASTRFETGFNIKIWGVSAL